MWFCMQTFNCCESSLHYHTASTVLPMAFLVHLSSPFLSQPPSTAVRTQVRKASKSHSACAMVLCSHAHVYSDMLVACTSDCIGVRTCMCWCVILGFYGTPMSPRGTTDLKRITKELSR